jgi:hypothetical protein
MFDVGEDIVSVMFALEAGQVLAVVPPHQGLHGRQRARHEVEDPHGPAGAKPAEERAEHRLPLGVGAEVVQHRGGQDHVEAPFREPRLPHVCLDGRHPPGGRGPDPLRRTVEHRPAQIEQRRVEAGQEFEQLERVVPGPAAHVEDLPGVRRGRRGRLRDQRHRQRGIDGGRLAGLEVAELLHVGVEPPPDLVHR